ncbi:MAG: TIGR03905 family TSCPD domain-containing protein [Firmicutes bacterium]|nr:TIGR03905 family TSCPD domain-containing protein [Bacillota bacterium]
MKYEYKTQGVCSMKIDFELDGNTVHNVSFLGGCDGNLKAIGKLVEGKDASEVVNILSGNTCGFKNTSCADQLAKAIADAMTRQ